MYAEMIKKSHASNMKLFTYPSQIEVFANLSSFRYVMYFSLPFLATLAGTAGDLLSISTSF
jgi:hypothetical protein